MKPHLTLLTLGVDDLPRAVGFYRDGLGWATQGIVGSEFAHGAVAFFNLQPGLKLALWPRRSLAAETGLALQPASATELSLGHNVGSAAEVDALMAQATRAGAHL
ncbi:MAG: VOC family protein, partial [Leptothrix sp. (in: b-proteobacteria)]